MNVDIALDQIWTLSACSYYIMWSFSCAFLYVPIFNVSDSIVAIFILGTSY